jgi:membrane protein DedA with SNARE-associated domain
VIESVVNGLGDAVDPWGYILLFALTLLEASAFIGLFVPGETALLLAGVLAQQGKVSLAGCIVCAVAGAILGDSLGYEIGRRFGPRMRKSRVGKKVGEDKWTKAHEYLRDKGGRSIFLGRFIGVLRALVPAVAGDSRMRYRTFLFWNVLGALIATPAVILAGYFAGQSYKQLESKLSYASWVLLACVVAFFAFKHFRKRNEPSTSKSKAKSVNSARS